MVQHKFKTTIGNNVSLDQIQPSLLQWGSEITLLLGQVQPLLRIFRCHCYWTSRQIMETNIQLASLTILTINKTNDGIWKDDNLVVKKFIKDLFSS